MAADTLEQLGLGTIETRLAQAPPYTAYWTDTLPDALQELGRSTPVMDAALRHYGQFAVELTATTVHDNDPFGLNGRHDRFLPGGHPVSNIASAIRAWQRSLGSLNVLPDAQGDLLRAAGLLLAANSNPLCGEFEPSSDDRSVYKAFASLWRNNSEGAPLPSRQYANGALLTAGQLVHTAALVDTNADRRGRLGNMAAGLYEQLGVGYDPPAEAQVSAGEYLADIRFQRAMDGWRRARRSSNQTLQDDSAAEMRSVMHERAAVLAEHCGQHSNREFLQTGRLFERYTRLLLRDFLLTHLDEDAIVGEYGVRTAFPHEDGEPFGMVLPIKPLFDIVAQRFRDEGVATTTPIQLKFKNGVNGKGALNRYLPGITVLAVFGITRGDIATGADFWARKYATPEFSGRAPRQVERLMGEVGESLLAA